LPSDFEKLLTDGINKIYRIEENETKSLNNPVNPVKVLAT
jgi:hypothetical protein